MGIYAMTLKILDHEETILRDIKDGTVGSLERTLLVLSGMKTDEEIRSYHYRINEIWGRFLRKFHGTDSSDHPKPPPYLHRTIAKGIFDYLWNSKPKRFGEHFLLSDVVDAQLDPDLNRLVGTCIGLTSLYSVLGLRAGLNLSLLANLDHLLSRLKVGEQTINIDHTDPQGFDCGSGDGFREFPLPAITANVLNSRGLRNEQCGNFAEAKADYRKAILVNQSYANAHNNSANMRLRDNDIDGAIADYTEAIRINPDFCEAFCNRGMAWQRLGRYDEAREDYNTAIRMNPSYGDAKKCLRLLDDTIPRSLKTIEDF
jgi:tetratricopeptide (TPR) repeat protein